MEVPERFLGEGGEDKAGMYVYSTFNAGPRLCLGKPLAMMEIKLITAMLLHSFDFTLAEPHDGGYGSTIVLPMKPGLMVSLTPRAAAGSEAYPVDFMPAHDDTAKAAKAAVAAAEAAPTVLLAAARAVYNM